MLFSSVVTSLLLAGAALAQQSTSTTSKSSKSTKTGTGTAPTGSGVSVMVIDVGKNGQKKMVPESVSVEPGTMIQFHFYPQNHSVVRSTFDQPCKPIEQSQPGSKIGFFSGFMPVKDTMGTFTIWVADSNPIWFYCSQGKHCQDGMVGVINPPKGNASRNIDTYRALAAKAPANISPSGNYSGGKNSSSTLTYSNTLLPTADTTSSATSSSTAPAATANAASDTMRVGGAMAVVAFGMALLI